MDDLPITRKRAQQLTRWLEHNRGQRMADAQSSTPFSVDAAFDSQPEEKQMIKSIARARFGAKSGVAAAVAVSLALAGCASPYAHVQPPAENVAAPPASLAYAFEYSRTYHRAYRAKVEELGDAERRQLNGLITLGGAILAAGMLGGHTQAIRNAAVVGGTGYALGRVNNDQRRAVIYVAGMKALECANEALAPLNLNDEKLKELGALVGEVKTSSVELSKHYGATYAVAMQLRQQVPDAAALQDAQAALDAAVAALQAADGPYVAGSDLLVKQALAGEQLRNAVLRIDAAVTDSVRGTEVSIQQLPVILSDLAGNVTMFSNLGTPATPGGDGLKGKPNAATVEGLGVPPPAPGAKAKALSGDEKELLKELGKAVSALRADTLALEFRSKVLRGAVTEILARLDPDRMAQCEVHVPIMKFKPQKVTFTEKVADVRLVEVRDGKPPYRPPTFGSSTPDGLSATFVGTGAKAWVLQIKADKDKLSAPATHKIIVEDSTGEVRLLTVNVVKSEDSSGDSGAGAGAGAGKPAALADLKAYILGLSPLKAGAGSVTLKDVKQNGKDIEVVYAPAAGAAVKRDEVTAALQADAKLKGMLGGQKVTAKAAAKP